MFNKKFCNLFLLLFISFSMVKSTNSCDDYLENSLPCLDDTFDIKNKDISNHFEQNDFYNDKEYFNEESYSVDDNKNFTSNDLSHQIEELSFKLDLIKKEIENSEEKNAIKELELQIINLKISSTPSKVTRFFHILSTLTSAKALYCAGLIICLGIYYGLISPEYVAKAALWVCKKALYLGYFLLKTLCRLGYKSVKNGLDKIKYEYFLDKQNGYNGDFYQWLVIKDNVTASVAALYM